MLLPHRTDHRGAYAKARLGYCPSSLATRQNVNEFTSALAARSVGESPFRVLLLMFRVQKYKEKSESPNKFSNIASYGGTSSAASNFCRIQFLIYRHIMVRSSLGSAPSRWCSTSFAMVSMTCCADSKLQLLRKASCYYSITSI